MNRPTHLDIERLFEAFSKNAPATNLSILEFEAARNCELPHTYKEFLTYSDGGEGPIGDQGYLKVWLIGDIGTSSALTQFPDYLPTYLPIGTNGGGEALAIRFGGAMRMFGFVPLADLNESSFIEISENFWTTLQIIGSGRAFDQ